MMMSSETKVSKEAAKVGAAVATTSGALGFAQSSFASTTQPEEVVSNLAGIDGRIAIFFVFAPVLGWVAYNILGPGLKQLDDMQVKNEEKRYRWWGDWERFGSVFDDATGKRGRRGTSRRELGGY